MKEKLFDDKNSNFQIYSDKATYLKNNEKVFTEGNSKAVNNGVTITADKWIKQNWKYYWSKRNVKIIDNKKDYKIFAEQLKYFKNEKKYFL